MYKCLIILFVLFSCENKQNNNLSKEDFIGTYKSSDDNFLDTLIIFKNETFRHVRFSNSNDSLLLLDNGIWSISDNGYTFKNYRFDVKDTNISYANFDPYFGAFNSICMDLDMDEQDKYVKIKK
jgi:hypothetical protein